MKQVLYSQSRTLAGTNANTYINVLSAIFGGNAVFESWASCPIPAAGTLRNLQITLAAAIATTRVYTIRKNGSATAITCTISPGGSSASDLTHSVTVAAGDLITLHQAQSGGNDTPSSNAAQIRIEFEADADATTIYGTGEFAQVSEFATNYIPLLGGASGPATTAEALHSGLASADGTLTTLYVQLDSTVTSPHSWTFTVLLNGTAQDGSGGTPDTRVVLSGAAAGNASFSLAVSQFDLISIRAVPSSFSAGSKRVRISAAFVADTDGQRHVSGGSNDAMTGGSTVEYHQPHGSNNLWTTSESTAIQRGGVEALRLGGLYVKVNAAPGSGKSWTFTLRKNGADTDLSVTIADSATDGSVEADVTIEDGDTWAMQVTPTSSPGSGSNTAKWAFTIAPETSTGNLLTGGNHTLTTPGSYNIIAGTNGTLANCNRVALLSLDGDAHSVSEREGALIVYGDLDLHGNADLGTTALDAVMSRIVTADGEVIVDDDGDVVFVET